MPRAVKKRDRESCTCLTRNRHTVYWTNDSGRQRKGMFVVESSRLWGAMVVESRGAGWRTGG